MAAFHNAHHRYAAHGGASRAELWRGGPRSLVAPGYQAPTRLPARGRIEVVRYVRSNRRVELFAKTITLGQDQTYQYVTAVSRVRARKVIVVNMDGEVIHHGDYRPSRIPH